MANGLHRLTVQEAQNATLGQAGYKLITTNTGTAVAGVEYVAVTVLSGTNATVATTSFDTTIYPDISASIVANGTTIYGRWNKITLGGTNPIAICYRG